MADVNPKGVSPFFWKSIKPEDDDASGGAQPMEDDAGRARPMEEVTEEPPLPLIPQSVQEEMAIVFNPYGMAAGSQAPSARRRRERVPDGPSSVLYVNRRKSKVWNYYTKLGDAYVECNVCKKQLSFHNSTTTMREHLVRKHSIRDTLLSQLKDDPASESDYATSETTLKRSRQMTPENHSEPRSDIIVELVLEMIFRDLHPLSMVEDKGFSLLLGYLEPSFSLPAPTQLSVMLRHRYNVVKQHLERYLQTVQAIAVSVEFWESRLGQTYLTITANVIDGEWQRVRCVLETQQAHRDEAGGNIVEKLYTVLSEFGLSGKSIFCVVQDSPWSVVANGQQLEDMHGWRSLCCAARSLQRCVQAGLEVEQIQEALSIARGIVQYFQQDSKASGSLKSKLEAINKSKMRLVMDTASRWISTMEMCESLLDLKWAILSILEEHPKGAAGIQNLADHQWKLLQDLIPVLRTIRIATSFLREGQNISVSSLMPCIHGIVAAIGQQAEEGSAVIKTVVSNIRLELTEQWGLSENEKVLENPAVIASFLDPRFKELRFLRPSLRSELHNCVKTMLSQVFHPPSTSTAPFWVPSSDSKMEGRDAGSYKERSSSTASQSIYDILLGKDPTENMPEIHQQLENYIVEPLCKRSTDPLDWWKNNERRFPAVAHLGRQYLTIPATAVLPHQAFAAGESTLEHRRAILAPENLDQIIFLHQNFDFLESLRSRNEGRNVV
ncbi:E3 SUMO-protein ligase ZBED1-like [Cuculus canorus]|uniref:E3 SUMO-protein ligase ZBED1-like n=1 Tax=Cuculus canorus TaxID=55661 RepID=UPI0023AAC364|nr:E3 SUMO-protein ligase ZBED1-like [Cuculus canorus]